MGRRDTSTVQPTEQEQETERSQRSIRQKYHSNGGKCQLRQRMWGVSGTVISGVKIEILAEKQLVMLDFLSTLQTTENTVYLSGDGEGLSIWLGGPRQAGNLITHWSSTVYPNTSIPMRPLLLPGQYNAIRPDDMLSAQEGFMAGECMDTYSVCPTCQAKGLHILSASATRKLCNPTRAIRFFVPLPVILQRTSCESCDSYALVTNS
jgi:hypothetical protein